MLIQADRLRGFLRVELVAKAVIGVLFIFSPAVVSADSLQGDSTEAEAAKIEKVLHAVTEAAKQYFGKTGKEASSIEQLVNAGLMPEIPDKNAEIVTNDHSWQSWGDGTGAYVMWNPEVSPEVCRKLNPGGTLPDDPSGKPDPSKGFQCIYFGLGRYYMLEPVYIHR